LTGSPIVAATVATIAGGAFATLRGQFDMVIFDEACQLTLPAVLGVLGFGRRFVLVGDHRQLPPVVQSAAPDGGPGLSESLFEYLARARAADGQPGLVRLEKQYRMNAEICGFPSRAWYDGRLRPAPAVAATRLDLGRGDGEWRGPEDSLLDPARPVVFVDVPGSTVNAPRSNRREAELARLVLEAARRHGLAAADLAVIAPFRAQVARIRAELARSPDAELRAQAHELADTVDRFQGSERPLVVYSFASYARELHPLMLDQRRLNVALTRAQRKLILLGDLRVLRAEPRFAELEAYCRGLYPDGGGVVEWHFAPEALTE
jgi:DNA replication ATP-dependent helicase Dna2